MKNIKVVDITQRLQRSVTCGGCVSLKDKLAIGEVQDRSLDNPCRDTVTKQDKICSRYRPNPAILKKAFQSKKSAENMMVLSKAIRRLPTDQLQLMTMLLMREHETREQGFHLMQRVVVRYLGTARANYISNFMSCRVLRADKNMIHLISEDGQVELRYQTRTMRDSIFSMSEYKVLHSEMKANGRFVDPKITEPTIPDSRYPVNNDDGTEVEISVPDRSEKGELADITDVTDNQASPETQDTVDILSGQFNGSIIFEPVGDGFDFDSMYDDAEHIHRDEDAVSVDLAGNVEVEL